MARVFEDLAKEQMERLPAVPFQLAFWGDEQASARRALGKSYLAKWLHGYFSSHAKPHPIRVAALMELSGSAAVRLRRFRESLRAALAEVAQVEAAEGRQFEWRLDDDLVHVTRGSR